jgi:hypothetical protein
MHWHTLVADRVRPRNLLPAAPEPAAAVAAAPARVDGDLVREWRCAHPPIIVPVRRVADASRMPAVGSAPMV